jgi:hypothetical protein
VRSISVRPKSNVPAFEVELFDGTGALTVIWLGRRRIAGVDPGRRMVVRGRLAQGGEHRVMYNPRYELKPAAA